MIVKAQLAYYLLDNALCTDGSEVIASTAAVKAAAAFRDPEAHT